MVVAVEKNVSLSNMLQALADKVYCEDFLECEDLGLFDKIIMNPPFENGADIKHIKHALKFLAVGGTLVALCANGPRQHRDLKGVLADYWEDLPAGSFKTSGTMVNSALLVIEN